MASTDELIKKMKKEYGDSVAQSGDQGFSDVVRLPTGIFPFDLASGGGFPMGRCSIIFGPESSNKTNICLKTIACGQLLFPEKKAVFVDAEGSWDSSWAEKMGVDPSRVIVLTPEYAEQAIDMTEAFLYAEDVFAVYLDSIAALSSQNEIESSAEKASVGGASLLVGRLYKKATISFNRMRNQGVMAPAFIATNQIRHKIGVMFGDPETMPGGNAPKFASSFTVRVYGKNVIEKKINPVMPAYKETNVIIRKWKMPILNVNSQFSMQMIEANGKGPGHVEDWNTISSYLKELDYLGKVDKGGWSMFGETYKTLEECKTALYGDPTTLMQAKAQIISEMMSKGGVGETNEEDASL